MIFQVLFAVISLIFCSTLPRDCLPYDEQIAELTADLDALQYSTSKMIDLFFNLKHFYRCFQSLFPFGAMGCESDKISKFYDLLLRYYEIIRSFYLKSPVDCLQTIRLCGNFEFAYMLSWNLSIEHNPSFCALQDPLYRIKVFTDDINRKFQSLKEGFLDNLGSIAKEILGRPYLEQADIDSDSNATPKSTYNAIVDWEMRKEALREVILSLKAFYKLAIHHDDKETIRCTMKKIKKYEFAIKKFQVDLNGPSYAHFLSLFHQIRCFVQQEDFYELIPSATMRLFFLFKTYHKHLIRYQLIDPSQFPTPMLAIVCRRRLRKKRIFKLLKSPSLLLDTIDFLRSYKIMPIYNSIGDWPSVNSWELKEGLANNLLSFGGTFTRKERWIIEVYLALLNDELKAKLASNRLDGKKRLK